MSRHDESIAIVGGGLAGNLAAILLAQRGLRPHVYERGPAHDGTDVPAGRTINLALAARGLAALERAGVRSHIEPLMLPLSGRIVHDEDGRTRKLAYGQKLAERIYSISRSELNRALYQLAAGRYAVSYSFATTCTAYDVATGVAAMQGPDGDFAVSSRLLLATDGAGSVIRKNLADAGAVECSEALLDHGYKELTIPPSQDGDFALDPDGLHIWPRGGFMLIALPNLDKSFTATLFLPKHGPVSFESAASDVSDFFQREFADVRPLLPDLDVQFERNPIGLLGTVYCAPWRSAAAGHRCLLLGDAAHAIVPFHGQGINAGFEDCIELDRLIAEHEEDWDIVTRKFESRRLPNAQAIAVMALENYVEMRDGVRDPDFERRKALAFELERRTHGRFTPRYSLVMFHPEVGYAEAERRGRIQDEILRRATAGETDDIDLALALTEREL